MKSRWRGLLALWMALALVACGDDGEQVECGPGTRLEGNLCVATGGTPNNDVNNDAPNNDANNDANNDVNNDTPNNDAPNNDPNNDAPDLDACTGNDDNEPNDAVAQATALDGAQTSFVGLCPDDVDLYALEVPAGHTILALMEAIGIEDDDPDTGIAFELLDAGGQRVAEGIRMGATVEINHVSVDGGVFLLSVRALTSTGVGYIYDVDAVTIEP